MGTLRRVSGSPSRTMSMLGALDVAELALKNRGLLSASPSRVGYMENPTFSMFFVNSPPPSNTPSAVHEFSASSVVEDVAAAGIWQQQQYTPVGCRICCTKPVDSWCTPNTEHLHGHDRPSTWDDIWYQGT